jgi:hypothetical protein
MRRSPLAVLHGPRRLEIRLAPAALTFSDVDGDLVTIKTSRGTATDLAGAVLFSPFQGLGQQLRALDLTTASAAFTGTSLSISARRQDADLDGDPDGDGLVNVGAINAAGLNLGTVTVGGDLGEIDAGAGAGVTAIAKLTVRSMGRLGPVTGSPTGISNINGRLGTLAIAGDINFAEIVVATGGAGSIDVGGSLIGTTGAFPGGTGHNAHVQVAGNVGRVRIGGDVVGGNTTQTGFLEVFGNLGSLAVGGSVLGGPGQQQGGIQIAGKLGSAAVGGDVIGGGDLSGMVESAGDMGPVTVGGNVVGGTGAFAGSIAAANATRMTSVTVRGSLLGGRIDGNDVGPVRVDGDIVGGPGLFDGSVLANRLTSVTVGGSVLGGPGDFSGSISGTDVGPVRIGRDVVGGAGQLSGRIDGSVGIRSVSLGGSLLGGAGDRSGEITSAGRIGAVTIQGNLRGGSLPDLSPDLDGSGLIQADRLGTVFVGGSVEAGTDRSGAGKLTRNASIRAGHDVGSVTVRGSLVGNTGPLGFTPVVISASGQAAVPAGATTDMAIGSLTVGGRVELTNILAGYDPTLSPVNGDAQVGRVAVGGDWIASNLVAGVQNPASANGLFGDGNDQSIGAGNTAIASRIGAVDIRGVVIGRDDGGNDHFGFSAQQIGSFRAGGVAAPVTPARDVIELAPLTGDVTVREV